MSKSGNAATKPATIPGRKCRRVPLTERGRLFLAWLDERGVSIRALSAATGLHQQTIVRAIHHDPAALAVATLDRLTAYGVPPDLLARSS